MTIDTLAIARELRAVELPMEPAEAIAAAIGHSISEGSATRGDLAALKLEVFAKVDQLNTRIDAKSRKPADDADALVRLPAVIMAAMKL